MAYVNSLDHSFVNFDEALDDVVLPAYGSAAIAFEFKLPAGAFSISANDAITVNITDVEGTTVIATIGSAVITDLCANAVIAGVDSEDDFPFVGFQTSQDLFVALQELGYTATGFSFFQCCPDLDDSVSAAGVTINLSRGIISVEIPNETATEFDTLGIDFEQCFKYSITIGATTLLSNPFKRIDSNKFLTWVEYSNNEDAYDFFYPLTTTKNKLWFPMYTYKSGYPEDRKIYLKSNKSYKLLKASIEKEWEAFVNYMPDKIHDRIVVAMAHDNVYFLNATINDFVFKKDAYDIDWDDNVLVDVATAKFHVEHQFAGRNSNCEERVPCITAPPPPPCTPVNIPSFVLPDARVNEAYSVSIAYTGTEPVIKTGETKPSWMTIDNPVSGHIRLHGTPTTSATGVFISVTLGNCSGTGTVTKTDTIDVISIPVNLG